ncbi:hypothetical protein DACRYDRAFT_19711 [Dacryopinax primogenitus]|uniref:Uncharacterized protein n=1 Tax=Dacryopinax primogenitus (strain DJM 731) TaxID=1858805 RepID=M5GFX0_DACPD|nr:uncharacterized protein DACRYDRAFT_19711 [Dacryopinax primogenitus]EJU06647.1 hypothetical protein DACRYDRAFT_19711 [Dacryopinax primogenitus]
MASFAFVPRSVKGKAKAIESVVTANVASTSTAPSHVQLKQSKTPRLATVNADDVLALFSMALSSYSLFIEPATRRLLDRDEYVRLQALISSSPLLSHLPPGITEAQIVSALRQLPADTRPEMRIGQHGYEVHFPRHELQHRTHSSWESSTVYVVGESPCKRAHINGGTQGAVRPPRRARRCNTSIDIH